MRIHYLIFWEHSFQYGSSYTNSSFKGMCLFLLQRRGELITSVLSHLLGTGKWETPVLKSDFKNTQDHLIVSLVWVMNSAFHASEKRVDQ